MILIKNKEEYEKNYYDGTSKPKTYPKKYPCLLYKEYEEGGIGGSYIEHYFITIPKNVDLDSYIKGIEKGLEVGKYGGTVQY